MTARIESGKLPPGLQGPECHCRFFVRYYLPCRHILQEHLFGDHEQPFLSDDAWKTFQHMFEESGMEVYQSRERVEVPMPIMTPDERIAEAYRLKFNEL
ncbi:hypothetical protein BGZ92_006474, partial [Podila epicladia]